MLDIVGDEGGTMTVGNAVYALHRMNALLKSSPAHRGGAAKRAAAAQITGTEGFGALCDSLVANVQLMNAMQLCNTLYAMSQLQVGVAITLS